MQRSLLISDDGNQVEFSVVESENPTRTNQVTDNPVENSVNIVDHVKAEPLYFQINGVVTGTNAGDVYSKLVRFWEKGLLLTYSGRNVIPNVVIETMPTIHDKDISNGFKFTITLKQIRIAILKYVDLTKVAIPLRPKKKTGKTTTNGKTESGQYVNQLLNDIAISKTGGG